MGSRKHPNVPSSPCRKWRPTQPQGKAGCVGLCWRIGLDSGGTRSLYALPLTHTHLPISCLEGEEDLLPLFVGATPQAVNDGLLVSPWGKRGGSRQGWGSRGCSAAGDFQAWVLPFFWVPQLHPYIHLSTTTGARLPPPSDPSPQRHWMTALGMGGGRAVDIRATGTLTKAFHSFSQDLGISQGVKARSVHDGASRSKLLRQTDLGEMLHPTDAR